MSENIEQFIESLDEDVQIECLHSPNRHLDRRMRGVEDIWQKKEENISLTKQVTHIQT